MVYGGGSDWSNPNWLRHRARPPSGCPTSRVPARSPAVSRARWAYSAGNAAASSACRRAHTLGRCAKRPRQSGHADGSHGFIARCMHQKHAAWPHALTQGLYSSSRQMEQRQSAGSIAVPLCGAALAARTALLPGAGHSTADALHSQTRLTPLRNNKPPTSRAQTRCCVWGISKLHADRKAGRKLYLYKCYGMNYLFPAFQRGGGNLTGGRAGSPGSHTISAVSVRTMAPRGRRVHRVYVRCPDETSSPRSCRKGWHPALQALSAHLYC
jgi:hypothetical protein